MGVCAYQGHTEMVALLIEFGANVTLTNSEGITAVGLAASCGHCDVVHLLVQAGASLTAKDRQNMTPVVQAAAAGHLNVVGYLLSCDWPGQDDLLKNQAHQALVVAASNGHNNVSRYQIILSVAIYCYMEIIHRHFRFAINLAFSFHGIIIFSPFIFS